MNHLSQIADKLSQYDLDAMLIVSEPGERYAVGFQGEGYVLVTREGSQYSTDGRYIEAAQKQVTGAEVVLTSRERSHLALARDFLAARGLKRVGFESAAVSVAQHRRWQESFPKGCELIPAQELLDGLRVSKDEEEIAAMLQAQNLFIWVTETELNFHPAVCMDIHLIDKLSQNVPIQGLKLPGPFKPFKARIVPRRFSFTYGSFLFQPADFLLERVNFRLEGALIVQILRLREQTVLHIGI